MHKYFIKTPWLVKRFFSSYVWSLPPAEGAVYLTFDDGPHPEITGWVLDELKRFGALGTFFCIGDNVRKYGQMYQRILDEGHAVGNHTYHHLNGWKTAEAGYVDDIRQAAGLIRSDLFRPPYGRIRSGQAAKVAGAMGVAEAQIIMWDVLSADFDRSISPEQCFRNVAENIEAGSVVVFHDSEKAWKNLEYTLPRTLELLRDAGLKADRIGRV